MFVFTLKSTTLKLFALLFCVAVVIIAATVEGSFHTDNIAVPSSDQAVQSQTNLATTEEINKSVQNRSEVECNTNELRVSYLENLGWQIDKSPFETQEIIIPSKFNSVYSNYNSLQKINGFDLSCYKGKTAIRYSYNVLNYPDETQKVKANLIILDGRLIGGDISSSALNGFMNGLCKSSQ